MKLPTFLFPFIAAILLQPVHGQTQGSSELAYVFDKGYGQVEVGGPYVGMEFHGSRPLPSRISFYYPVANSIDFSADYWKRGDSHPMAIGVRYGVAKKRLLGLESWAYTLSPHTVTFHREEQSVAYSIRYEFCFNEPAAVMTMILRNISDSQLPIELYTHLRLMLRTCQTFARKDLPLTEYGGATGALGAHFDDPETDSATVFVLNSGERYSDWTTSAGKVGATDSGTTRWLHTDPFSEPEHTPQTGRQRAVAAFKYAKNVDPGDSLVVVQIIGSSRRSEWKYIAGKLALSWEDEVAAYDRFIRSKAYDEALFCTGDSLLDRSAVWARALIAANAHYLDGSMVPMPCPAEYNFFFTHDLLLTNLGAVNFDLPRVKRDLLYVASHARDNIIPHAYYWKDDGFKTEYCTPDNWNHLWFILVTGSYLRHAMDDSTGQVLLPLVRKSVEEVLKQKKTDNLMHGFRPDWWDIGHVEGPRAYLTILTIRALEEYLFISAVLGHSSSLSNEYEQVADNMQAALSNQLWNDESKYLMDRNGVVPDQHYYMGPLLAPTFGVLDGKKARELVATAGRELLDGRIGVRAAMPPDFHTKASIGFYKLAGDEAGQPYYYINGGVWPHNNAWYALALKSVGKVDEAAAFVKRTMTLDGIANSPMGTPAMYEYRFSDPASVEFGKIDKPSFLWAGGFYLYTLYHLFGVGENAWNVSITGPLPSATPSVRYSLAFGETKLVNVHGKGDRLRAASVDGKDLPSLVLPLEKAGGKCVNIEFGTPDRPYLERVNARLHSALFDIEKKSLLLKVSSFKGHHTVATVVVMKPPTKVVLDGRTQRKYTVQTEKDGMKVLTISFAGSDKHQTLEIVF